MIRTIGLAAALAILPLSPALAASDPNAKTQAAASTSEARIEALAEAFEARMEAFGTQAEAIAADRTLTETQREAATATLWSTEFQPEVTAFTARMSAEAGAIAQAALADIDVDTLVAEAMKDVDLTGAMAAAGGIARNSAWVQNDPEQAVTYGLIAQYTLDQAMDAVAEDAEPVKALEPQEPPETR